MKNYDMMEETNIGFQKMKNSKQEKEPRQDKKRAKDSYNRELIRQAKRGY